MGVKFYDNTVYSIVFKTFLSYNKQRNFEKGKPSESWGRKVTDLKLPKTAMIAKLPKLRTNDGFGSCANPCFLKKNKLSLIRPNIKKLETVTIKINENI